MELARDWERYLNVKYRKELGKRPLTVYIAPATRDKLLPYLDEGLSDVSIGNLTVTDERLNSSTSYRATRAGARSTRWW